MSNYFIRGMIKVSINLSATEIRITPSTGFLTPEKTSMAVAYPVDISDDKTAINKAILLALKEEYLVCDATDIKEYLPSLISAAAQQKPIELILKEPEPEPVPKQEPETVPAPTPVPAPVKDAPKPKIIGFVFPTK